MNELTPITEGFYQPIQTEWIERSGLDKATFKKEASFAMQIMEKNDYLRTCNPNSILKAVLNVAQIGLTLNPVSKYAYLVPRGGECVLDPSYMGLVKLLTDSGSVKSIQCQLIYDGDEIEVDFASDRKITKHIPYVITGNEQGNIRAVYSVATLHDDSFHCELMSRRDVEEIREKSEAYKAYKNPQKPNVKTCIWIDHEGEMFRKTCIKRHFKHLPKSGNLDRFEKAVELSHTAAGFDEPVSYELIGYIEHLIGNSILGEEEKDKIESGLIEIDYTHQANKIVKYLQNNQKTVGVERLPANEIEIRELSSQKANQDD